MSGLIKLLLSALCTGGLAAKFNHTIEVTLDELSPMLAFKDWRHAHRYDESGQFISQRYGPVIDSEPHTVDLLFNFVGCGLSLEGRIQGDGSDYEHRPSIGLLNITGDHPTQDINWSNSTTELARATLSDDPQLVTGNISVDAVQGQLSFDSLTIAVPVVGGS